MSTPEDRRRTASGLAIKRSGAAPLRPGRAVDVSYPPEAEAFPRPIRSFQAGKHSAACGPDPGRAAPRAGRVCLALAATSPALALVAVSG